MPSSTQVGKVPKAFETWSRKLHGRALKELSRRLKRIAEGWSILENFKGRF